MRRLRATPSRPPDVHQRREVRGLHQGRVEAMLGPEMLAQPDELEGGAAELARDPEPSGARIAKLERVDGHAGVEVPLLGIKTRRPVGPFRSGHLRLSAKLIYEPP